MKFKLNIVKLFLIYWIDSQCYITQTQIQFQSSIFIFFGPERKFSILSFFIFASNFFFPSFCFFLHQFFHMQPFSFHITSSRKSPAATHTQTFCSIYEENSINNKEKKFYKKISIIILLTGCEISHTHVHNQHTLTLYIEKKKQKKIFIVTIITKMGVNERKRRKCWWWWDEGWVGIKSTTLKRLYGKFYEGAFDWEKLILISIMAQVSSPLFILSLLNSPCFLFCFTSPFIISTSVHMLTRPLTLSIYVYVCEFFSPFTYNISLLGNVKWLAETGMKKEKEQEEKLTRGFLLRRSAWVIYSSSFSARDFH